MKLSEIYENAAAEVDLVPYNHERHQAACDAISKNATGVEVTEAKENFSYWFCPPGKINDEFWFGSTKERGNKQPRVLALLFAAAIARSEGR